MNQELMDRVVQSPRLPSLPSIAVEVIGLVQRPDVNIKQIADTIQNDPALAGQVLRTVNSSFYGQSYAVSTITHALVVLGLNSVKTLALGFSLAPYLRQVGGDGFDHLDYWKRSLYSATAARALSRSLGLVQQEEAFLSGLMQDVGMLALNHTLGDSYGRLLAASGGEHGRLVHLEQKHLRLDHAQVGGALAQRWNLPPLLVAPIRFHESPDDADADLVPLVRCVALGNRVAEVFMSAEPGEALAGYYASAKAWFDIDADAAAPMLKQVHAAAGETRRLLDLPADEFGNPDEILARANQVLMQITLQTQQQTSELEQQNQVLAEQAQTDSLTGAANRRRFNEFITEQFDRAVAGAEPLSVLFLDADHFKAFNDNYGHPTGDRVLVALARLLMDSVPPSGLVARYGGEEFAAVLPGMDRRSAAHLAERVRERIEAARVARDHGEPLSTTASIGVATFEGRFFERAEQLIKAADQGVYAAKAAGRNCVRIFTPKAKAAAA